jgi:hypothetical protein
MWYEKQSSSNIHLNSEEDRLSPRPNSSDFDNPISIVLRYPKTFEGILILLDSRRPIDHIEKGPRGHSRIFPGPAPKRERNPPR